MKTSIIILTYNKIEYTKICIESIRKYTKLDTYEIIVIDNNSNDGTIEWLLEQRDIITIFNDKNLGFPKGCNQGIEIATGDNILLLNNDTVVTPRWLDNMETCLYSENNIGAVGLVTNYCSNYQTIEADYTTMEELFEFAERYNVSNKDFWEDRLKLVGFCLMIKKEVVSKIGYLDEIFTPGNCEDDDYCFRIKKAGYRLVLCKDTYIHHFGSISFKENPEAYKEYLKVNRKKFEDKWGFKVSVSCNISYDIIEQIKEKKEKSMNVLEIGCGYGATLLKLKDLYKNCNVYGIEKNTGSAELANCVAEVVCTDIEKNALDYQLKFFDYIILGNVLEQYKDPWGILSKLSKYLKSDGYIIARIPNIMHISVIKDLLNGNWTYDDSSILRKESIRFFTINEIKKMFQMQGYLDLEITGEKLPISDEDEILINKLAQITKKETEEYLMYQYIVKAGIKKEKNKNDMSYEVENHNIYNIESNDMKDKFNIKFILRRIENDINTEENIAKLMKIIQENIIQEFEIIEVIRKDIIKKIELLNFLAINCYKNEIYDSIIPFLQEAYNINNKDKDTIYNLAFILNEFGEKQAALNYLSEYEDKDENIDNLIKEITEQI